jgi:hypothetical protein
MDLHAWPFSVEPANEIGFDECNRPDAGTARKVRQDGGKHGEALAAQGLDAGLAGQGTAAEVLVDEDAHAAIANPWSNGFLLVEHGP